VVGCIPESEDRILLCRRAIEPQRGWWTLPAGYLENGETIAAGAERETREETGAGIRNLTPYLLFNICHINQIYFMFRGQVVDAGGRPGKESLEVRLFAEAEIPWEQIAFRVISATLKRYFHDRRLGSFSFSVDDIGPAPQGKFPIER
jgi:ADP-ribose pyrophosphatase YjhB (NUDIX family)